MPVLWNLAQTTEDAKKTQVFSGGACNVRDGSGNLWRNRERDAINEWLHQKGIRLFDPQIHPDTHGIGYAYEIHHPIELAARESAKVNLYEVNPYTFGGISMMEIAMDHFRYDEPMVIYFSDGDPETDYIPEHSKAGHPLFVPMGLDNKNELSMRAHYAEMLKNGTNMRRYLVKFAQEMDTLTVVYSDEISVFEKESYIITPKRLHAVDMLKAIVQAASGKRTIVNFIGGEKSRDEKGRPVLTLPKEPPMIELQTLIDQYLDEGNQLRVSIAQLVEISVFVRVAYTQKATILGLEEILRLRKLI